MGPARNRVSRPAVSHRRELQFTRSTLAAKSLSTAPGSEIQRPLATVVIGGMASGTSLDAVSTPAVHWNMAISINADAIARDVVVIGASAGGIRAVTELLSRLPEDLHAFIGVVIHRGDRSPSNWASMIGRRTKLRVVEPAHGDSLTRGAVYIAPSDQHMTFENGAVSLDRNEKKHSTRPAVDPLFMSAARSYGRRVVGVVLTGGGWDGMLGLRDIAAAGGVTLAQQPSDAEIPSMPEHAIAANHVTAVLTVDEIGEVLVCLARGNAWSC
jgi:two-component system chemotaxis response regulator CheB